ncbi:MAG TPA: hypothetical protein VKX28_19145 [Xanthobacteraceae bacterium]|nr:hypothetical protein [Xanthobacteraceae bacterium]
MTLIKLLTAPIRRLVGMPLFQLCVVVLIVFLLQGAPDHSVFGRVYDGLDKLVSGSIALIADAISVKSFTQALLTVALMIFYVFLVCLIALAIARRLIRRGVDFAGRKNLFGLRNTIARERGIEAYRAWEPLEHLRPPNVPQPVWEERFAWPADNRPPYPSLWRRIAFEVASFVIFVLLILVLLQEVVGLPVFAWVADAGKALRGWVGL